VPACEDFYRFACGGWIAKNEIPPDKPRWGRGFDPLRERNLAELRAILDAEAAGKSAAAVGRVRAAVSNPLTWHAGLDPLRSSV